MPSKLQAFGLSIPQARKENALRILKQMSNRKQDWKPIEYGLIDLDEYCMMI